MKKKYAILFVLLTALTIYSCGKTDNESSADKEKNENTESGNISSAGIKESGKEFDVRYNSPRKIYNIVKEDVNNDGNREIFVLSILKDTADKFSSYYNFDMVEIFSLDRSSEKYIKILTDTVDYSTEISFENIPKDESKLILIKTNTGGNDALNSEGMFVYQMKDSANIELLKYFETGSPEVSDLKKDGTKELIVMDQFLGVMPQVNAVSFIREIYTMKDNKLILSNEEFPEVYDEKISELIDNYNSLKRKVEMGMQPMDLSYPLYREAAEIFVNYYSKGDMQGLKNFWDKEKDSLKKNIPNDEFQDLNSFISKALPSSSNA
ncbi:MAG: hypothetical protein WAT71_10445 [Ignavibacteria bacterium]